MKTYDRLIAKADKAKRCLERLSAGDYVPSIVVEERVCHSQLKRWAEESGLHFKCSKRGRPKGRSMEMETRILMMRDMRYRGDTVRSISEQFGIGIHRVYKLLKE